MIDISTAESRAILKSYGGSLVEPEVFVKNIQEIEPVDPSTYCVMFSEKPASYCIGVVDMVGSTKLAASLGMLRMSKYYQNFLNLMSKIIEVYDGKVIKNVGDCLLFYFPHTRTLQDKSEIRKCIECSFAMIDVHEFLCTRMKKEGLPCVDYRVSIDCGYVIPMRSSDSKAPDMIGPAVNMCSKINRCAEKNGIVVGGDLYQIASNIEGYHFKENRGFSVGFKQDYPVYLLTRKQNK